MAYQKIGWIVDTTPQAQKMVQEIGADLSLPPKEADVLVCIGGDGFMLHSIQKFRHLNHPFFGINAGSVGFLMNAPFGEKSIQERLNDAQMVTLLPLKGSIQTDGQTQEIHAINEISFLRHGPQAAKVRVHVDGVVRLSELVCDGAMVATPAGSTAYNFSAYGPILPLESALLALTPISAFRPRRWRGALIPCTSQVMFEVLEPLKRPILVYADGVEVGQALKITIQQDQAAAQFKLLFDRGRDLSERILSEQFTS